MSLSPRKGSRKEDLISWSEDEEKQQRFFSKSIGFVLDVHGGKVEMEVFVFFHLVASKKLSGFTLLIYLILVSLNAFVCRVLS